MSKINGNNLFKGNRLSKFLFTLSFIFLCLAGITLISRIETYDLISKKIISSEIPWKIAILWFVLSLIAGYISYRLARGRQNIEKELEEMYTQMLSLSFGMTLEQAHKEVKEAIKLCKRQAITEGTINLPKNYGDLLIQAAKSGDSNTKKIVEKAHRGGAMDEDIREFWNLNDLQRRMAIYSENMFRAALAETLWKPGLSKDEENVIASTIRKTFPMYGDPDNTSVTSGDDRPLPHELRGRVDRWRNKEGPQKLKKKMVKYSTFNVMVRDEIRKGNL